MSKFCSTFAPAFEKTGVFGEWRSPVAQRSGGPEVACSNHVSPTKRMVSTVLFRWREWHALLPDKLMGN